MDRCFRNDFSVFDAHPSLIYLDTAASAQKPRPVLAAMQSFHEESYANIHRGVYALSQRATELFEQSRKKVQRLLNAPSPDEVIFTRGATESINLVAYAWGERFIGPGDEILVTLFEHHSNLVPWQQLAARKGAVVKYVGLDDTGELSVDSFRRQLSSRTKMFAVTQLANGIGLAPPLELLIPEAKAVGAHVLVDAAQSVSHRPIDVAKLGADFVAFSGHKLYGPTGIGVLWGRKELLLKMPPFLSGGDMIRTVSTEGSTFAALPAKFEAGTPNIAGAIGLGAAIDYVLKIGLLTIAEHEDQLVRQLETELQALPDVQILGPAGKHHALLTFVTKSVHPHDLAQILDQEGVAIRAGHHCAQPLINALGLHASARISFGIYNMKEDVSRAVQAVDKAIRFFRR